MSFSEIVVIFIVALVVFGPDKIPELAKNLGKLTGQAKKTTDSLRRELYNNLYPPGSSDSSPLNFNPRAELQDISRQVKDLLVELPTSKPTTDDQKKKS